MRSESIIDGLIGPDEHSAEWKGATVYHGTGRSHAGSIGKKIDIQKGCGYFGYAFYVADDPELAKSNYADMADDEPAILKFKISPKARIADARVEDNRWATFLKVSEQGRGLGDPGMPARMIAAGVDGVYDRSMGGLAIYNPKVLIPQGEWNPGVAEAAMSTPVSKLVPPPLPEPLTNDVADTPDGTEDLSHAAFDYIESEVGRLDWERNWPAYKNRHGDKMRDRVSSWLRHFEMDHDPDSIIKFIDDYHTMHRSEKWL